MSIDYCANCGKRVDTDMDDCFYDCDVEGLGENEGLCETCREKAYAEEYEQSMETQFNQLGAM